MALAPRRRWSALPPPPPPVNSHQRNPLFQFTSLTISAFAGPSEMEGFGGAIASPFLFIRPCTITTSPTLSQIFRLSDGPGLLLVAASQIMGRGKKRVTNAIRGELNATYRTRAIISRGLYTVYPIFHCGL